MHKKGQGALEYLLLIGGAVLVAVIVISIMINMTNIAREETRKAMAKALCTEGAAVDSTNDCRIDNNGDPRVVVVEENTYRCKGDYPNCALDLS